MGKLGKLLSSRLFIISILILIQILLIVVPMFFLSTIFVPLFLGFLIIRFIMSIIIVNRTSYP